MPEARAGGGAAHEHELLRLAARDHEIHLITSASEDMTGTVDLGGRTVPVKAVGWRSPKPVRSPLRPPAEAILHWPTREARAQRDRVRSLAAAVARHVASRPVEIVHLTFSEIAPVVAVSRAPTGLLLFDVRSRQLRRQREVARSRPGRAALEVESRKVAAWERRWFSRMDGLASVSAVDRDALRTALGREVSLISNPVPDEFFDPPSVARSTATVTFVGNLAYGPNVDAVRWLADEIWPLVRRARPDASLEVVGHGPRPEVAAAVASVGGDLQANVADIRPFYWRAAVAVAPLRLGSGLRNKILHAVACGAPVVATPTALEGIQACGGRELWVADTTPRIAGAIVAALNDRGEAERRAAAARELLSEHRSEPVAARFNAWWESVTGGRNGGRP